jgi:CheY-like chemotaxis protein
MDKNLPKEKTGEISASPDSTPMESAGKPDAPSPVKNWYQQKTILIVDDMLMMRFMVRAQLEEMRFRVLESENGEKALDIIRIEMGKEWGGGIDLLIADVVMPGMDGLEMIRKIRQELGHAKLPVIVCTARGEIDIVHRAKLLGVQGFLVKPIAKPKLLAAIRRILG